MKNRGWILIAVGNPVYYRMAFNLAMSLRLRLEQTGKEATKYPITLLHDGQTGIYSDTQKTVFDNLLEFDNEDQAIIEKQPFYAKTLLDKYTPYEHSIYLDVDSLCVGPADVLFDETADYPFAALLNKNWAFDEAKAYEESGMRPVEWCEISAIYEHVGAGADGIFSDINSSVISWTLDNETGISPNEEIKSGDIFNRARLFFTETPPPVRLYGKAGNFPDELAFECAMLELGYVNPSFKGKMHFITNADGGAGYVSWIQAGKLKPFLSLFGPKATTPQGVWNLYKQLIPAFTRKLEKQQPERFPLGSLNDGFKNVSPADKAGAGHDKKHFNREYKGI